MLKKQVFCLKSHGVTIPSCLSAIFNSLLSFTPSFICVLRTFGRDLKWNPHFNYTFLRYAFRTALLDLLEANIDSSFKTLKSKCYREHENGFTFMQSLTGTTSRIDSYDGNFVTFHYNRHEDNQYIEETLPILDFIRRIIQHIPEKHFKRKTQSLSFLQPLA
ncbi:MAG: transposase [Anaerostipes sp.]|nr:transposase [Anaerostipes sp.]